MLRYLDYEFPSRVDDYRGLVLEDHRLPHNAAKACGAIPGPGLMESIYWRQQIDTIQSQDHW
jgi:hypothetical protein